MTLPTRRAVRSRLLLPALALAAAGLAGCSSGSGTTAAAKATPTVPVFRTGSASPAPCLEHQTAAPTDAYRFGTSNLVGRPLSVLRYYKDNGDKSFCDGKPATATDLAWMSLYVQIGGDKTKVARWTGAGS